MSLAEYLRFRRARSLLKAGIRQASAIRNMQRDEAGEVNDAALCGAIASARDVWRRARTSREQEAALEALSAAVGPGTAWKPLHPNALAENFEVLVVAIAVAMAFRCYFLEPFKIPTGSMQPTLYGIYSSDQAVPELWDRMPLKLAKWLVTGDWYEEIRVVAGGTIHQVPTTVKPGFVTFEIAGKLYHVPTDAVSERRQPFVEKLRTQTRVASGEKLWSGVTHAGDHVFVNRVLWNFRKPRRGEVMVFNTGSIRGLPQGTHYIKRLVGLPGETIGVRPPELLVDGEAVSEPATIGRIVRQEAAPHPEAGYPNYLGYKLIGNVPPPGAPAPSPLRFAGDTVSLGPDEYLGMGDNTGNSYDGRYWGAVPARNLLGPGAFVYWPFTSKRLGLIH